MWNLAGEWYNKRVTLRSKVVLLIRTPVDKGMAAPDTAAVLCGTDLYPQDEY